VDIETAIDAMHDSIALRDWARLEKESDEACEQADPARAEVVRSIALAPYVAALKTGLDAAAGHLPRDVAAIYWEFDVDNRWSSAFFLCRSYRSEEDGDDEWASDFDPALTIAGPSMPLLASQLASTWNGSPRDAAVNAFLVARTIASIGRASTNWGHQVPLCAGYHDQWVVFRVA
jgi:hypothetical protein